DRMYRHQVHGRKGPGMQGISVVDCALWDIKGKWLNAPVHSLLGGPTRSSVPAYASMLGYSAEPSRAAEEARALVRQGYTALKLFLRHSAWAGSDGVERNVAHVRAVREAVGADVELMLDVWSSWDVPYCMMISERLAEYRPRWLEEPVLADRLNSYAVLRE